MYTGSLVWRDLEQDTLKYYLLVIIDISGDIFSSVDWLVWVWP